jgi:hypothetical protein
MLTVACATAPPPLAPVCAPCEVPHAEIARLQQELANREAELRDLRSQQRDQVKALQESAKQVERAKVKLRRLATQAAAASYIAEVEVALAAARLAQGAGSRASLLAMAQEILDSSAAPFAQGDYGAAMDLAAQAEQMLATLPDAPVRPAARVRATPKRPFDAAILLQVTIDSNLRRQPRGNAPVITVLKAGTPVVAQAYRNNWLRVETADGRTGWVYQSLLTAR